MLEIVSVHGWFEWFGMDALRAGLAIGFVGASDDHTGRPGGSYPTRPEFGVRNGLAAVYASELTKPSDPCRLRARHCYATTGGRMVLAVTSDEHTMGDAWSAAVAPAIDVEVLGTTGIEVIELLDVDRVVERWRPPARPGTRLRVSRRGARGRNRSRFQRWDGALTVEGAAIRSATPWAFDAPHQGITSMDSRSVAWRSNTSGDPDGVILELADEGPEASLHLSAADIDMTFDLDAVGVEPLTTAVAGGVERAIELVRLPDEPLEKDVRVTLRDAAPAPGRHAYFVRVRQEDGHQAWTSPMFVRLV